MLSRVLNRARLWAVPHLFKKVDAPSLDVRHERVEHPFAKKQARLSSAKVAQVYDVASRTVDHVERIAALDGDYRIDPHSGFVLQGDSRRVISEAIVYDHPSVYPRLRAPRGAVEVRLPEVAQFDHHWGITYFHFYSDVLHKLWMLDALKGVMPDVPLVVSRRTFESRVFRFFRQFPEVSERNWRVQEAHEVIRSPRVWLVRCMPFEPSYWHRTRALVQRYREPVKAGRRIFINRPARIGRTVGNVDALRPVLTRYGFEFVELEDASLERQVALFSGAEAVVSMHGAALTNLIYSDTPTRVLELMPDGAISCHYYWVADVMGLPRYDVTLGGLLKTNRLTNPRGRFDVAPETLDASLRALLDGAP